MKVHYFPSPQVFAPPGPQASFLFYLLSLTFASPILPLFHFKESIKWLPFPRLLHSTAFTWNSSQWHRPNSTLCRFFLGEMFHLFTFHASYYTMPCNSIYHRRNVNKMFLWFIIYCLYISKECKFRKGEVNTNFLSPLFFIKTEMNRIYDTLIKLKLADDRKKDRKNIMKNNCY